MLKRAKTKNANSRQNKNDYTKLKEILQKRGLLTKESVFRNIVENKNIRQTGKVLLAAAFITGGIAIAVMAPNLLGALGRLNKNLSRARKRSLSKTFYNMQNNGLIKKGRRANQVFFTITSKGRSVFIKRYLKEIKIAKQPKWDRVWRIVLFDIPVDKNSERDILRDRLKHMGFFQFQKSAFITPFPCQMELEAMTEYYGLTEYVTFLETQKISGEEKCRRYFNLR